MPRLRVPSELRQSADLMRVPTEFRFSPPKTVEFVAAPEDGDKLPRFLIVAYSGGAATPSGWGSPVVTDLTGLRVVAKLPLLFNHSLDEVIGHVEKCSVGRDKIDIAGVISGVGARSQEVIAAAKNGFPWQVSIGCQVQRVVRVDVGERVEVNGRQFTGPMFVVRQSLLREISFTPVGADPNTSATLAQSQTLGVEIMRYEQWLTQRGFHLAEISEEQNKALRLMYDAETNPPANPPADPPADPPAPPLNQFAAAVATPLTLVQHREAEAVEVERVAAIRRVAVDHPTIAANAIRQAWSPERAELEVLRASRPTMPTIYSSGGGRTNPQTLEVAMRLGSAESEASLLAEYGAETMEAAYPLRRMGMRELIQACCAMDGVALPSIGAGPSQLVQAGFSTSSLSGILSATAHKTMVAAYQSVPSTARTVARKLTAGDFKTHTGYRLTGDFTLKQVGSGGELTHGNAGESKFDYAVDTYGRVFGITRQMLKNDDLGAFAEIPRMIGRGAAIAVERAFWTLVLANTGTFFGSGNANYISGATTVLSPAGLVQALTKLRKQVDANKDPILLLPKYLAVPPELEAAADELFKSAYNVLAGVTDVKAPSANVHMGKYVPVVSPYLSATGFHASVSAAAWYLFGDPADVAAFGIAYLDGVETPIIEDAPLAGDVLGQAWRGYLDFGVCQIDPRGAVKSKGEA